MMKIMIVDDEKLLRKGFVHMTDWSNHGYDIVAEAASGKEALQLIEELQPDIVVTDIRMPEMDGIELTRIIKRDYAHIQVIILSSYDDFDYVKETLKLGAADYILKARMEFQELISVLGSVRRKLEPGSGEGTAEGANSARGVSAGMVQTSLRSDSRHLLEEAILAIDKYDLQELGGKAKETIVAMQSSVREIDLNAARFILIEVYYHLVHCLRETGYDTKKLTEYKFIHFQALEAAASGSELLGAFEAVVREIHDTIDTLKHGKRPVIIDKVIDYIRSNYASDISLSTAAKEFHLNKNYLCELFKQHTGENFHNFLSKTRIDKSKELLRQTDLSIYAASERVGYSNPSYFGKQFKQQTGMTPSEFVHLGHAAPDHSPIRT